MTHDFRCPPIGIIALVGGDGGCGGGSGGGGGSDGGSMVVVIVSDQFVEAYKDPPDHLSHSLP